jgi:hypothetical protein
MSNANSKSAASEVVVAAVERSLAKKTKSNN